MAERQTRRPQKPLSERACGFESRSGHTVLPFQRLFKRTGPPRSHEKVTSRAVPAGCRPPPCPDPELPAQAGTAPAVRSRPRRITRRISSPKRTRCSIRAAATGLDVGPQPWMAQHRQGPTPEVLDVRHGLVAVGDEALHELTGEALIDGRAGLCLAELRHDARVRPRRRGFLRPVRSSWMSSASRPATICITSISIWADPAACGVSAAWRVPIAVCMPTGGSTFPSSSRQSRGTLTNASRKFH